MKTCKECKWWELREVLPHEWPYGVCQNAAMGSSELSANGAYHSTPMVCGPNFGCIHREPKEVEA